MSNPKPRKSGDRSSSGTASLSGTSTASPNGDPLTAEPPSGGVDTTTPGGKGARRKGRPVFRRSHSVTEAQLATLQDRFPSWDFEFGDQAPHSHPLGATERAICESMVIKTIRDRYGNPRITDIGGNANRHAQEKRANVHSCNPIVSSDDVVRRSYYVPNANYCSNLSTECALDVDVYISIHSLYYLTPDEVLELTHRSSKGRLFAVVHRFTDLYGEMHLNGDYAETKYESFIDPSGSLKVRMQVVGNSTSYCHDSLAWLSTSSHSGKVRGKSLSICWTGRPVGDSWIYEFVATPEGVTVPRNDSVGTMSLTASLSRRDHCGSVEGVLTPGDEGAFKPMLSVLKLKTSKIRSFGPCLWVSRGHEKAVLLPKGIIEDVASKMVGVSRDKAGLRLCINTMKQRVKPEKMSMPARMRLDCIIYGSALAFILTLKEEVAAFNELCQPFHRRLYAKLSGVMSLDSPLFAWEMGRMCFPTWVCCGGGAFNATYEEYEATRASVPGQTFDAKSIWPNGLPGYESKRPLAAIRGGATLEGADRTEVEDKPQFHAVCTTFSNYIPVVPYASINNESVSLANRALKVVPTADNELWGRLHDYAKRWEEKFYKVECELEKDFEEWNSKFSVAKQRKHAVAWDDLKVSPLNKKDFIRKQFVKRELTMKGGAEPEEFDPRAIQANSDRLSVSFGPFVAKSTKQLKEVWHSGAKITYTAGMTAEEIGEWRGQFGDEEVIIIELDESRYDCHHGRGSYELTTAMYRKQGIADYGNAEFANTSGKRIEGFSSHGVKYSVPWTMDSGRANTSQSNTYVNGNKTSFALEECGIKNYRMLVHGDDSLIVIRGRWSARYTSHFKGCFLSFQRMLGFTTKMKISTSWPEVEYCSSLFWPVEGGFCLGPKIGKRLPKCGFSLTKLTEGEVKGMLLGLSIEASFVPVIRVYVKHQLGLMRAVTKQQYYDRRAVYKSFAISKHKCNDDTAYFFLERYGFEMQEMEQLLSSSLSGNLTDCVDYPAMHLFTAIDL